MDLPPCNFRPILPNIDENQRPNIYRSNSLDDGTIDSCTWLLNSMEIKSYIDLREAREYHQDSKLKQFFSLKQDKRNSANTDQRNSGYLFHFRFITFAYYLKVMAFRLSWRQIFRIFVLLVRHIFQRDYEYQKYGGSCYLNPLGIVMINKDLFPMIISCTFGKDRTGIVAAILMQLNGCSDEGIIDQYAESEKLLFPLKKEVHDFFHARGVNETFEGSPPNAMEEILHFLKEKYNGSEGYLRHCGLSQNDIDAIKRNIRHRTMDSVK